MAGGLSCKHQTSDPITLDLIFIVQFRLHCSLVDLHIHSLHWDASFEGILPYRSCFVHHTIKGILRDNYHFDHNLDGDIHGHSNYYHNSFDDCE